MARKGAIQMNNYRKRLCEKYNDKRQQLKKEMRNSSLSIQEKMAIQHKLDRLPRNSSPTRHINRCFISGRPRGYMRFFGVSRIWVRNLARYGRIPGVRAASW